MIEHRECPLWWRNFWGSGQKGLQEYSKERREQDLVSQNDVRVVDNLVVDSTYKKVALRRRLQCLSLFSFYFLLLISLQSGSGEFSGKGTEDHGRICCFLLG